ncbi:MAG: O-antigen ligase family protein [Lachnospiraceae bacterium]|nr:O-antigen ligase family protein [Lachnospiraceae bacterium]
MKRRILKDKRFNVYSLALALILIGNICFYKVETLPLYFGLCGAGIVAAFYEKIVKNHFYLQIKGCICWLSSIYLLFTVYGCFFLRAGSYNWDQILFTYFQCVALYFIFFELLKKPVWNEWLRVPFFMAMVFSLFYLLYEERNNIIHGGMRIGDTLSGNVNTVAVCFGMCSMILAASYSIGKKKRDFFLWALTAVCMLLTGSKKAVIILGFEFLLFFFYSKNKLWTGIKLIVLGLAILILVLDVEYFYILIGKRIIDMFKQLFAGSTELRYSRSTDERMQMILSGFQVFVNHPLLGGGMKYFYYMTDFGYEYSHCNYTELLCNFGLAGFALYYFPFFKNLLYMLKLQSRKHRGSILAAILVITMLVLDWAMVSYSDLCIFYIPVIFSFAMADAIKTERTQICYEQA